jgi:pimeloyl-ACP methyl ester carboxylesterase
MPRVKNPIGFPARMNAAVLFAFTPEYGMIKASRKMAGAGECSLEKHESSIKPGFTVIDGTRVRYADNRKQDAPVVLLLSPLPQSILCFDSIWKKLDAHFRLIALDLPGFGRSDGGLGFMSFKAQGAFLEKFVNEMQLNDVHIVGPDVGTPAVLDYVIHRNHMAASILIGDGPAVNPSRNGSIINKAVNWSFWRMVFILTGPETFVYGAYKLAALKYVPSAEEVDDYVKSYSHGRIRAITHWFKTYPENLATIDPFLNELKLPTQIFWGDKDVFLTTENATQLHERLPHSALTIFKDCGHYAYQDEPDEFARMVIDWVNGGYREV